MNRYLWLHKNSPQSSAWVRGRRNKREVPDTELFLFLPQWSKSWPRDFLHFAKRSLSPPSSLLSRHQKGEGRFLIPAFAPWHAVLQRLAPGSHRLRKRSQGCAEAEWRGCQGATQARHMTHRMSVQALRLQEIVKYIHECVGYKLLVKKPTQPAWYLRAHYVPAQEVCCHAWSWAAQLQATGPWKRRYHFNFEVVFLRTLPSAKTSGKKGMKGVVFSIWSERCALSSKRIFHSSQAGRSRGAVTCICSPPPFPQVSISKAETTVFLSLWEVKDACSAGLQEMA